MNFTKPAMCFNKPHLLKERERQQIRNNLQTDRPEDALEELSMNYPAVSTLICLHTVYTILLIRPDDHTAWHADKAKPSRCHRCRRSMLQMATGGGGF